MHHYYHASEDNSEVGKSYRCAWCNGAGTKKNEITGRAKTCDVCGGTGFNKLTGIVKPCAKCKGTGVEGKSLVMNVPRKCDVCKGKGYNEI